MINIIFNIIHRQDKWMNTHDLSTRAVWFDSRAFHVCLLLRALFISLVMLDGRSIEQKSFSSRCHQHIINFYAINNTLMPWFRFSTAFLFPFRSIEIECIVNRREKKLRTKKLLKKFSSVDFFPSSILIHIYVRCGWNHLKCIVVLWRACACVGAAKKRKEEKIQKEITKINRNEFIGFHESEITFWHAKRKVHQ